MEEATDTRADIDLGTTATAVGVQPQYGIDQSPAATRRVLHRALTRLALVLTSKPGADG